MPARPTSRWASSGRGATSTRLQLHGDVLGGPRLRQADPRRRGVHRHRPARSGCSHPATIKALGDWAFCEGINRFVFHRYAMQPWLDRKPGMSMGPWGLHYERTQTWWEQSEAWHEYLARCQYLLRQGCSWPTSATSSRRARRGGSIRPMPPTTGQHARPAGLQLRRLHAGSGADAHAVQDGRLVLPDGMSYRLLVLPEAADHDARACCARSRSWSRPARRWSGRAPVQSPSLADYPAVRRRGEEDGRPSCGATATARPSRSIGSARDASSGGKRPRKSWPA